MTSYVMISTTLSHSTEQGTIVANPRGKLRATLQEKEARIAIDRTTSSMETLRTRMTSTAFTQNSRVAKTEVVRQERAHFLARELMAEKVTFMGPGLRLIAASQGSIKQGLVHTSTHRVKIASTMKMIRSVAQHSTEVVTHAPTVKLSITKSGASTQQRTA